MIILVLLKGCGGHKNEEPLIILRNIESDESHRFKKNETDTIFVFKRDTLILTDSIFIENQKIVLLHEPSKSDTVFIYLEEDTNNIENLIEIKREGNLELISSKTPSLLCYNRRTPLNITTNINNNNTDNNKLFFGPSLSTNMRRINYVGVDLILVNNSTFSMRGGLGIGPNIYNERLTSPYFNYGVYYKITPN